MLETALAAQRLYAYTNRSANERAVRANAVDVVARDGLAENAIGVGDQAPMFVLQDGMGAEVDVQVLLETGPVVLLLLPGRVVSVLQSRAAGLPAATGADQKRWAPPWWRSVPSCRTERCPRPRLTCWAIRCSPMWTTRWHGSTG